MSATWIICEAGKSILFDQCHGNLEMEIIITKQKMQLQLSLSPDFITSSHCSIVSNNCYGIRIVHGHCSSMLYKLRVLPYLICAVPCLAQAPYITISSIKYLTEGPYKKELAHTVHTVLASDIWQEISPRWDENTHSTMMYFGNMEEWTLNAVKTEC